LKLNVWSKSLASKYCCTFVPLSSYGPPLRTLAAPRGIFAPANYTLTCVHYLAVTNYFDGCYAQKRERFVEC